MITRESYNDGSRTLQTKGHTFTVTSLLCKMTLIKWDARALYFNTGSLNPQSVDFGESIYCSVGPARICSEPLDILRQTFAAFRGWDIDILLSFARLVSMVMLISGRIPR